MYEEMGPADITNNPPPPPPPPPPAAAVPPGQKSPGPTGAVPAVQSKNPLRDDDSVDLFSATSNVNPVKKGGSSKKNKKSTKVAKKEEDNATGVSSSKKKKKTKGGTTKTGSKEDVDVDVGKPAPPEEAKPRIWLIPAILFAIGLIIVIFSVALVIMSL